MNVQAQRTGYSNPSPPKTPRTPEQQAYMTKVKNLVFKAMGAHPTGSKSRLTKAQYNQLILGYFQKKMEPQQAAQAILQKTQASK